MDPPNANLHAFFRRAGRYARSLLTNLYLWAGLAVLALLAFGVYVFLNNVLMPAVTRHDVSVTVPRVMDRPFDEARQTLEARDLEVEKVELQYNPELPREVVIEQNPAAEAAVKPGRRVYLTINSGETPMVKLPSVENLSLREARNRLRALGLTADDIRVDSIPLEYPNVVTQQEPAPGDSLPRGSDVTLWYSEGNQNAPYVSVPDVTGQTVRQAQETLLGEKLRSVVIDGGSEEDEDAENGGSVDGAAREEDQKENEIVQRQSREPGTSVREGFELRLFIRQAGADSAETASEEP